MHSSNFFFQYGLKVEWNTFNLLKMVDRSTSFFEINDVIRTSLPLLKIINLFVGQRLDFIRHLIIFNVFFGLWENLIKFGFCQ